MNEIPKGQPSEPAIHFRESASGLGCLLIIVSLFTAGAVAAVYNIAAVRPIEIGPLVASILWLMLIGAIVIPAYRKHGFQQIVVRLGASVFRKRLLFAMDENGVQFLCLGYPFAGTIHYLWKIRTEGILAVAWDPGQGNDPTRNNHWLTWIHVLESAFGNGSIVDDNRHRILEITAGSKVSQVAMGARVIAFLHANSIPLATPAPDLVGATGEFVRTLSSWQHLVRVRGSEYVAEIMPIVRRDKQGKIHFEKPAFEEPVIVREIRGTVVYCERASGSEHQEQVSR